MFSLTTDTAFVLSVFWQYQDVSTLVRKYLPPGAVFEMYQFYVGWCDAHQIEKKASNLGPMIILSKILLSNISYLFLIFWHLYIPIMGLWYVVVCVLITALRLPIQQVCDLSSPVECKVDLCDEV